MEHLRSSISFFKGYDCWVKGVRYQRTEMTKVENKLYEKDFVENII